jgi:ribulose-phosphate 3-epimerase
MNITVKQLLDRAPHLSVGILPANLLSFGWEQEALNQAGVQLVHVDVMDGVFCSQMTFGVALVKAIPDKFVKDVHLMIEEPRCSTV